MIEKIDHIGIAVNKLDDGLKLFQNIFNLELISIQVLDQHLVKVAKFAIGGVNIELIEPTCPDSPVAKFLSKKGPGLHHLAFRTSDFENQTAHLELNSISCINSIENGADGAQIIFLQPKQTLGVLIELTDGGLENEA